MRKASVIVLFFVLASIHAYSLEIKGRVVSQDGNPVAKVVILHRSGQKKTETDNLGYFVLQVNPERKVKLEIIHQDYVEQEITLTPEDIQKEITVKLVPYIRQREEVVVTALRYPELSSSVPAAGTVITKESLEEKLSPNVVENLVGMTGLSSIGTGGFSLVPSIRGLARRRVLIMIDNARIISDRRTGPSASFVNPSDIEKIEVLRSPSSVFYGSDAIGGVIHIFTKKPVLRKGTKGNISLRYGTVNQEKGFGISFQGAGEKTGIYLSLRGTDAENYSSPRREILQSQFTTGSLFGKISYTTEKREIHLSFLGARGLNIGKPNVDSSVKPTWYPFESQNLIQINWEEKDIGGQGDLSFRLYLNPQFLETKKEKLGIYKTKESYSRTDSLDIGFQVSYGKKFGKNLRFKGGADIFGRLAVKARNTVTLYDSSSEIESRIEELPFSEGKRNDMGFFLSFDYSGVKNLDLVGGLRFDILGMQARPGNSPYLQKNRYRAWTGFIGASARLTGTAVAFINVSRAYRAPSLSERFYTGITGRGFVIGKPDLRPETSFNLDLGMKFIHKRYFAALYFFFYRIDDMVERYVASGNIYSYGNIERGKIHGMEIEIEYFPVPGWKLFGNFYSLKGISQFTGGSLNDIPPSSVFLGSRIWKGHFWGEINCRLQTEKKNPGPAEISIPGYVVFNLQAGYLIHSRMQVFVSISNLSNRSYLARPDPSSTEAPGRNLILGLRYSF